MSLINGRDKFLSYNPDLKERSRKLRSNMTPAEKKLWFEYLRNHERRFARQKSLDNFIADFYCSSAKLVIEIDGSSHFSEQAQAYDRERTGILEKYGLRVLRFTNQEVVQNFESVKKKIDSMLSLT